MKIFDRRRSYLIHRLQYGFIALCVSYVFFFLLVVSIALFAPLLADLRGNVDLSPNAERAAENLLYLHKSFWLPALIAVVVICLHAVLTSHRVVGPLHRHRAAFRALAAGTVPVPIRLRQGDYLGEHTEELNAMIEDLRLRLVELQEDHHRHVESLDKLCAVAGHASREELAERLADLSEAATRAAAKLDHFRIER